NKTDGRFTSGWTYEAPAGVATVSLDTPFAGWHPLEICYQNLGWTMENYEVRHTPTPTDADEPFVAVRFRKPLESYGYLYYGVRDARGRSLSPPSPQPWMPSGWVRLCKRFGLRPASKDESDIAAAVTAGPYEQEQLFVETVVPL